MEALEGQHSETFTYARVKFTPWSTSWPKTRGMSRRLNSCSAWSSDRMTMKLGLPLALMVLGAVSLADAEDWGLGRGDPCTLPDPVHAVATSAMRIQASPAARNTCIGGSLPGHPGFWGHLAIRGAFGEEKPAWRVYLPAR